MKNKFKKLQNKSQVKLFEATLALSISGELDNSISRNISQLRSFVNRKSESQTFRKSASVTYMCKSKKYTSFTPKNLECFSPHNACALPPFSQFSCPLLSSFYYKHETLLYYYFAHQFVFIYEQYRVRLSLLSFFFF